MSRPEVDKSLKQNFIKVILTKNQGRSQINKERVRIKMSRYVELNRAHYCTGKFNIVLSLCRVLRVTLYFSKGFLKVAVRGLAVAKVL